MFNDQSHKKDEKRKRDANELNHKIINSSKQVNKERDSKSLKNLRYKPKYFWHNKKDLYPSITHFNLYSFFIYDLGKPGNFISTIENKNTIKLNEYEFNFALEEIRNLNLIVEKNSEINYNELSLEDIKSIINYFSVEPNNDDIVGWIRKKISNNKNRENFSCNKLSKLYFIEKGMKLSKTKIYYILKNNLNFHYLKTSTKQIKLNKPDSLLCAFALLK